MLISFGLVLALIFSSFFFGAMGILAYLAEIQKGVKRGTRYSMWMSVLIFLLLTVYLAVMVTQKLEVP